MNTADEAKALFSGNENVEFKIVTEDATYGTYPKLTASGSGNRGTDLALASSLPDANATTTAVTYCVEFDAYISLGSIKARSQSEIALGAGTAPTTGQNALVGASYAFDAYTTTPTDNDAGVNTDWNSPGYGNTYAIPNKAWCHYKILVNAKYAESGNTYATVATITNTSTGSAILSEQTVTATGLPTYLHLLLGRGNSGDSIDNILVYK